MILQAEHHVPSPKEQADAHARVQAQASLPVQAARISDLYRRLMSGRSWRGPAARKTGD
jgi:hypothetical protein